MRSLSVLVLAACGARAPAQLGNTGAAAHDLMVAIPMYLSGVTIASIGDGGVRVLVRGDRGDKFGWLDARTLIVLDDSRGGLGPAVRRYLDGRLAETIEIPAAEWDASSGATLALTGTGQAWMSRCDREADDLMGCEAWSYLRVVPAPRVWAKREPPGVELSRTAHAYTGADPWPLPPTVTGPPGIALRLVPIDLQDRKLAGVECRSAKQRVVYPDAATWDISSGYEAHAVRWVQQVPPLYEVFADAINPVNEHEPEHVYFRPCEAAPLDNYAWLGDGMWGAYEKPEGQGGDGQWTFYRGETELGTLDGLDALRPNRGPDPAR